MSAGEPGKLPWGVGAPVQYGPKVRALAVSLHEYQLVPLARVSELLDDLCACEVSEGTVLTWVEFAAKRDRWASYDHYPCAQSICGAHLVRDCVYVSEQEQQAWAAEMADLLLSMAKAADEWRQRGAQAVPAEERDAWVAQYFDLVAKYANQSQEALEAGLFAAELVERHDIPSGAPLRTKEGALSLLVSGPSGQRHPLALLRFVEGSPLDVADPGAASLYGQLLGRTHTLLQGLAEQVTLDVYDFLLQEEAYAASQSGLAELIYRACTAAREFEARRAVTSGVIWADRMEIVLEKESGRVGLIDWGAIERGPLLFDVALPLLWLFPKGSQASEEFLHAYLAAAPITSDELEGLPYYTALLWARQAKFFAYRVAANVTLGDPHPRSNAERLVEARQVLEHFVAHAHGMRNELSSSKEGTCDHIDPATEQQLRSVAIIE